MTDMSKMTSESGWYQLHNQSNLDHAHEDDALLIGWEQITPVSEGYSQSEPLDDPVDDAASMS